MGRRAAQELQTEAIAELFRAHARTLTGALSAAGYPDASDAVQEAFAQAVVHWRKVAHYDDRLLWAAASCDQQGPEPASHSRAAARGRAAPRRTSRTRD